MSQTYMLIMLSCLDYGMRQLEPNCFYPRFYLTFMSDLFIFDSLIICSIKPLHYYKNWFSIPFDVRIGLHIECTIADCCLTYHNHSSQLGVASLCISLCHQLHNRVL